METEEWTKKLVKERKFLKTPIGAAFQRFKNAHGRAWQFDTEDAMREQVRKATRDAWVKVQEAEHELRALIEPLAGV